ncbi:MAG: hypothetical protein CYPHOPRED_005172 [Cyphobasidiales sp. Tagirdzhanova-0007]|nr:MAG: hypothetical protein CYPHOPRED_005172 [Cyphobasidiales sp. Tagirdzhanova-0007]
MPGIDGPPLRSSAVTIPQPPYPVDGNGSFSNIALAVLVVFSPWVLFKFFIPYFTLGFWSYLLFLPLTGIPTAIGYWLFVSRIGGFKREAVVRTLPNKPMSYYFTFKDIEFARQYSNRKIPMTTFYEAYFDQKLDFNHDILQTMEARHDWASFALTTAFFYDFFTRFLPDVIMHTSVQDAEQIRDHYDRGNDFYNWFLGPRMIYTSGVVRDETRIETLEELQDNKLAFVCHKLDLKPEDRLLDIGCGWGTLTAYAAKNFGCDATGVTLAREQTKFGTERIAQNGISPNRARILCMDAHDIPDSPAGRFTKITSLEQAEHVGVRRYQSFMCKIFNLLDDDGIFLLQVAGLRPSWQYEDLIWGMFMNKYIFPGADASCSLGWHINQLESAGFEVKSIDVLGVHYSATIWRWYMNWLQNAGRCSEKYGEKLDRVWRLFLAWSVIVARQGGSSVFQITLHKNLNKFNRIDGVKSHSSLHFAKREGTSAVEGSPRLD